MIYIENTTIAVVLLIILVILAVIGIFALYALAAFHREEIERESENNQTTK